MSENTSRIMTLPPLALRGVSVFPGTVLHFDVERPMSIAALNAAIGTDRMIFLVAQRDIACDTPRADDLYTVGTICRLSQILRAPGGGNVKCIVDGLYRAKLLRLTAETRRFGQMSGCLPISRSMRTRSNARRLSDRATSSLPSTPPRRERSDRRRCFV